MKQRHAIPCCILGFMLMVPVSWAGPKEPRDHAWERNSAFEQFDQNAERLQAERRMREERGVQRLKQHRWQPGFVMPQHYRGEAYKVQYRDYDLPRPSSNQQWYKINNDFILVDSSSNSIVRIMSF